MYCPKCSKKTKVVDSRLQSDQVVRRRRKCRKCGYRFTTWESIMNMNSRESLLKKPQRKLSKIKQLAQEIIIGITESESKE